MSVLITGMGAMTALGHGVNALWSGALEGRVALGKSRHIEAGDVLVGEVDLSPSAGVERAYTMALLAAKEALAAAGHAIATNRSGLFLATTKGGAQIDDTTPALSALALRLAQALGPFDRVETHSVACASSIVALGIAKRAITSGVLDCALVIGVDVLSELIFRGFAALRSLDVSGARPFDKTRAGLSLGEGAAAIVLERTSKREAISLLGYGSSNDAHHITGPSREGLGLHRALVEALQDAHLGASDIGLIVAHGTATPYNDAMEGVAYTRLLERRRVPVHAIKGAIGHILGGSGLINVILAAKGLETGLCPPIAGLSEPDPEIKLAVTAASAATIEGEVAIASASGFAGINAAVVLGRARKQVANPSRGVVITGAIELDPDRASLLPKVDADTRRRVDDLSLAGLVLTHEVLQHAQLRPQQLAEQRHALFLGSMLGSLESDHKFCRDLATLGPERVNPRNFAYTLPNVVLGEVAIAQQLMGENICVSAGRASGLTAVAQAASAIEAGHFDAAIVLVIDIAGPSASHLFAAPRSIAAALVLEAESSARARQAPMRATVSSPRVGLTSRSEPSGDEELGGGGVRALLALVGAAEKKHRVIRFDCPSGYTASLEVDTR